MQKPIISISIMVLTLVLVLSIVGAQGTGSGGAAAPLNGSGGIAPSPSNASASVEGGMIYSSVNVSYDAEIIDIFNKNQSAEIRVLIYLKDESGLSKESEQNEWFSERINTVLATLSDQDFRLVGKSSSGFGGFMTKQGFDKLVRDQRVKVIYKDVGGSIAENTDLKNESTFEEATNTSAEEFINNSSNTSGESKQSWAAMAVIIILIIILLYFIIRNIKKR